MGAAYSVVVLIALAGDPSVVTVRIALSLTIGAFAPALLVLATVRRRNDLWILTATAVAVAVVAVAEWQLDRHVIPLYPGVIFDALERGDHLRSRAAGMFAMFQYLSIYLQDILGYSPLATGIRFLPLTGFVFIVPLVTRHLAARVPLRVKISAGLALIAAGLGLMYGLSADSGWTALLAGFVVGGIGIGIANPALAAGALRVVDPARTGMASGISNTFRLGGVAVGVAALGVLLENRVENSLSTTAGANADALGAAVSSAGIRAVAGRPDLIEPAKTAFASGLNDLILAGSLLLVVGALAAVILLRSTAPASVPVTDNV